MATVDKTIRTLQTNVRPIRKSGTESSKCISLRNAEDILTLFRLSEADGKKYGVVKDKFKNHSLNALIKYMSEQGLIKGDNYQESRQTISLRLVEHCSYREMQDEMIRDRIVVGIQDAALSEKLQLEADLSAIRQSELIKQQQPMVKGDEQKVEAISNKKVTHFRKHGNDPPKQITKTGGMRQRHIQDAGRTGHNQQHRDCPVK